jgi:hypothetical protein
MIDDIFTFFFQVPGGTRTGCTTVPVYTTSFFLFIHLL